MAIQAAAASWVIRLDSDPADRIRNAANAWIDADPRHAAAFAQAELAWEGACHVRLRDDDSADPTAIPPPAVSRTINRRALGAGLLAASAVGAMGLTRWLDPSADRHRTGRGQQIVTHLADGSSIALNTDTILDVRLGGAQRTVRLLEGEALFDVARDSRRPFVVDLGDARIRVLGTSFNIRRRQDRAELTVTHGVVAVYGANRQTMRVGAGETTLVRPDLLATTDLDDDRIRQRVAWQEGYIELNDETLEQAVAEFNRYRARPIVVADPRIASLMVSGRFGIRESREFLGALASSFAIRADTITDGSIALTSDARPLLR